jgi:hypothetical protein
MPIGRAHCQIDAAARVPIIGRNDVETSRLESVVPT